MKRVIAIFLIISIILCGCGQSVSDSPKDIPETAKTEAVSKSVDTDIQETSEKDVEEVKEIPEDEIGDDSEYNYSPEFDGLDDKDLLRYIEDDIYTGLVSDLNSDKYYVENVHAVYVSKEYLEEISYNSQSNIFFGYSLEDIEKVYGDKKYVFTLGENGDTIVAPFEDYDDTYDQIIKNVAIGTGVILVCVTVSVVTAGAGAPAISLIFAASAKTGAIMALSSGALSGVASGVVTGIQTGDMNKAVKAGALAGSEGFKWGAISGAVAGGASEAIALKGATLNGLTMNEAAVIQKETGYPLDVIKQFHSTKEYEVFKNAGLKAEMVNGKAALVRNDIDLSKIDEFGRTNLQRMQKGLSPLDASGKSYELHHIGQETDATLAILTQAEHDNAALHGFKAISEIDRPEFAVIRKNFWKTMAKLLESGAI